MKKSQAVAQGPRANESKHTPGPWDLIPASKEYPIIEIKRAGYLIAQINLLNPQPQLGNVIDYTEAYANAALIAAAPDLKSIAELFSKVLGGEISLASINRDSVAKAIAKAEGRSE